MFYGETEFKDTEIGKIPKDWEVVRLKDIIALYQTGIWGENPTPDDRAYPVIRSTEITHDGKLDLSNVAFRKIPKDKVNKYSLKSGDILIVGSSGSSHLIGRAALFQQPNDGKIYLFSNFMIRIRPNSEITSKFLYYYFNSELYYSFLKRLQQTSTGLRNLPKKDFINLLLPLPSLEEQSKIAEILSTIDKAIEKTNEIIARTERLKKGLMQELLIKGLGHKEFKDTEIGKIPKDWEIVRLEQVCIKIRDIDHKMPKKVEKGYPFVSVKYMLKFPDYKFEINYDDPDLEFISENDFKYHRERFDAEVDDIIYSRFGTIGHARLIKTSEPFIASYSIVLIKPKKNVVYPLFLVYTLNSEMVRLQAKIATKGSTNRNLHLEDIKRLTLPLPPLEEQKKIAQILSTVDKKLEIEKKEKEKLERIKRGFMDLLLTGKVRVCL